MTDKRLKIISRLQNSGSSRDAYINAKLSVLISSQIRALRLKTKGDQRQLHLANSAGMRQFRISLMETPGKVNFRLSTLTRLAAAFKVGLIVKFVSFSEMLEWDNSYSQDDFSVVRLPDDKKFLLPSEINNNDSTRFGNTIKFPGQKPEDIFTEAELMDWAMRHGWKLVTVVERFDATGKGKK